MTAVANKLVKIRFVATKENEADILTKNASTGHRWPVTPASALVDRGARAVSRAARPSPDGPDCVEELL